MMIVKLICKRVEKELYTKDGPDGKPTRYEHVNVHLSSEPPTSPLSVTYNPEPIIFISLSGSSEDLGSYVVGREYTVQVEK